MNPIWLNSELPPDIMDILECTKRTESGMRYFFRIEAPQKQEKNLDPYEPKVLFLGTLVKCESTGHADLRNLSELEETPEAPDEQGLLTYINQVAAYV